MEAFFCNLFSPSFSLRRLGMMIRPVLSILNCQALSHAFCHHLWQQNSEAQYVPQSRTVSYIATTFAIGTRACTL
jgi:hypothetical protein